MLRLLPAATIVPTVWRRRGNWTQWKDPIAGANDPKSGLPLAQTQRKLRAWGMTSTYEHLCCEMNSFTWTIWRYKHRYCIFQMLSKCTLHASCFVVGWCSTRSSLYGRFAMLAKCEGYFVSAFTWYVPLDLAIQELAQEEVSSCHSCLDVLLTSKIALGQEVGKKSAELWDQN